MSLELDKMFNDSMSLAKEKEDNLTPEEADFLQKEAEKKAEEEAKIQNILNKANQDIKARQERAEMLARQQVAERNMKARSSGNSESGEQKPAEEAHSEDEDFHREIEHADTKVQTAENNPNIQKIPPPVTTPKSSTKSKSSGRPSKSAGDVCQIRDFPRCLLDMIKRNFPSASATDAVAAFCYAYRDTNVRVDYSNLKPEVIELAKSIDKNNRIISMDKSVGSMKRDLHETLKLLNMMMMEIEYLISDRAGYYKNAQGTPNSPNDIVFSDKSIEDIHNNVERTFRKLIAESNISEGRPIR